MADRSIMEHTWRCPVDGLAIPKGSWSRMLVMLKNGRARFEGVRCERGHPAIVEEDAAGVATVYRLSYLEPRPLAPAPVLIAAPPKIVEDDPRPPLVIVTVPRRKR